MGAFERMLSALPDHLSLDLRPEPVASIAYDGTCRLRLQVDEDELLLVVSGGTGETTRMVLSEHGTISGLLAAIDALQGFTVTTLNVDLADNLDPLALVDSDHLLSEVDTLYCGTSVLWYVLRLLTASAGSITGRYQEALGQLNVFLAGGGWLDLWGWLYGVLRYPGESDTTYLRRLVWTVTLPRCDNRAIEEYLRRGLGVESRVTDTSREVFHLNDSTPALLLWHDLATYAAVPRCGYEHSDGYLYIGTAAGLAYAYLLRTNGYQHVIEVAGALPTGDGAITALGAFGGVLYVAQTLKIYSWNGVTLTLAHTVGSAVVAMAATAGLLYCLLADGTTVTFDGAVWAVGPATGLAEVHDMFTWGSTLVACGNEGIDGVVTRIVGGVWVIMGAVFIGLDCMCLGAHADGLRVGLDDGTIWKWNGVDTWAVEYDTTQTEVTSLGSFDSDLYAGTATAAHLYRYDGSAWSDVGILGDGLSQVNDLVGFEKIGELIILLALLGRQYHYWLAVHSGNTLPSLLNIAANPVLAPGMHLYAFTVYADIPEYMEGLLHPVAQVAQAVHIWKAAGTRFRLVDTTVSVLPYPTPAIGVVCESVLV